jgi:hypothetical protein
MSMSRWNRAKRLFDNRYGRTLLWFCIVQTVLLPLSLICLKYVEYFNNSVSIEALQIGIFIICSFGLVSMNTGTFRSELNRLLTNRTPLKNEDGLKIDQMQERSVTYLDHSKKLSYAVFILVIGHWVFISKEKQELWHWILLGTEFLSIWLFVIFVVVDLWCINMCNLYLSHPIDDETVSVKNGVNKNPITREDSRAINKFKVNIKLYLFSSDGPGLFGLVIITLLSITVRPLVDFRYWQGFVVGAMGLHMAISQASLAFLSAESEPIMELVAEQKALAISGGQGGSIS